VATDAQRVLTRRLQGVADINLRRDAHGPDVAPGTQNAQLAWLLL
jgi:hypothetical protein